MEGGQAGVGPVDGGFIIILPRAQDVQVFQRGRADPQVPVIGNQHVAEQVFPDRNGTLLAGVAGILPDGHRQGGLARLGQRVGDKEILGLGEPVIPLRPEILGRAFRFGLQVGGGEELSRLDGHPVAVRFKIRTELLRVRKVKPERTDGIALAEGNMVCYIHFPLVDPDLALDGGTIVTDVLEVVEHVVDGSLDHVRVIDDRRLSNPLQELPHPVLRILSTPVVDGQEGIPAEEDGGVRFLADIGLEFPGVEGAVVDLDLVPGQPEFPVMEGTGRAAGRQQEGGQQQAGEDIPTCIHQAQI